MLCIANRQQLTQHVEGLLGQRSTPELAEAMTEQVRWFAYGTRSC